MSSIRTFTIQALGLLATIVLFLRICNALLASDEVWIGRQRHVQQPMDQSPQQIVFSESRGSLQHVDDNRLDVFGDSHRSWVSGSANELQQSLPALLDALEVMQGHFFEVWQGTWPDSIDWTAAMLGTHLSAALATMSSSLHDLIASGDINQPLAGTKPGLYEVRRNMIERYFSQLVTFYFGQNAFSLRTQAYDDMLWVVLGWLESIKFINLHSTLYEPVPSSAGRENTNFNWHGGQFIPAFAHRARLFYDIALHGWGTKLCHGGMTWNPHLTPYKNAITNELFIAASISMYLYFPGDDNPSPFESTSTSQIPPAKAHDPKYLASARDAYHWLVNVNMTNDAGLFVDGFHISGWRRNGSHVDTECDIRDEMVYTYNQGVLLTGSRGLWESTGEQSYLEDGHRLVRAVINATGWTGSPPDPAALGDDATWAGLGRGGVMEEICDAGGYCSQNSQSFKGIFFHHLTQFCAPLPRRPLVPGKTYYADAATAHLHKESCSSYGAWIKHNARAAFATKDARGEYGAWWGKHDASDERFDEEHRLPPGAVDRMSMDPSTGFEMRDFGKKFMSTNDVNSRGRGRTVETQGMAIAVLRALWELVDRPELGR
ncbi:MAG: hypothetical protein M1825_003399 [Sarcosagium campestre]|nr:MAG: hypothetical protein M1825_003399 [Sarcosagium campestre]